MVSTTGTENQEDFVAIGSVMWYSDMHPSDSKQGAQRRFKAKPIVLSVTNCSIDNKPLDTEELILIYLKLVIGFLTSHDILESMSSSRKYQKNSFPFLC